MKKFLTVSLLILLSSAVLAEDPESPHKSPVMNWLALGHFNFQGKNPKDLTPFFLEAFIKRTESGELPKLLDGNKAEWISIEAEPTSGFINLELLPSGWKERSFCLLVTQIWSEAETEITFSFGSDYWALVLLNGAVLLDRTNRRGPPKPSELETKAKLMQGWNTITVGLISGSQGSGFWFNAKTNTRLFSHASKNIPRTSPADMAADPTTAKIKSLKKPEHSEFFWIRPKKFITAFASIDVGNPVGSVNRRILGACLMRPPNTEINESARENFGRFSDNFIEAIRPLTRDTSLRIWLHPDNQYWTAWWSDVLQKLGTSSENYAFLNKTFRREAVRYVSEDDNNLYPNQTPKSFANFLRTVNKSESSEFRFKHWELWNEPIFPVYGEWDPVQYARWCVDTARRMKEVDPNVLLGPHMYGGGEWNIKLLEELSKYDLGLFGFIVNHYYDVTWFRQWDIYGSYYGKVAYPEMIRQHVQRDLRLLDKYAKGLWPLVITEWNVHPQRYDWPGVTSRDMATALFQASTLQVFAEEGVDAAQVFLIHGDNFSLIGDTDGQRKFPPYFVFLLYSEYFRGELLRDQTISAGFAWRDSTIKPEGPALFIPYIDLIATKQNDNVTLFIVNKHPDSDIQLSVELRNYKSFPRRALKTSLISSDKEAELASLQDSAFDINDNNKVIINLPKHSFSVIRLVN